MALKPGLRVPKPLAEPIGMIAGVSLSAMLWSRLSYWAPLRSILFTKMRVGMRSRCKVRIRTRVCGCTPSTAETTSTAPSSTLKHPFHLGDEIRVARRVDQVDRDVVDDERHDGGLDRDAALPFQR